MRIRCSVAFFFLLQCVLFVDSQSLSACGDKFVPVGRGVRFQNAYAAIHPAYILIVVPPKSVKNAAVRDTRLVKALKMAGHRVDVVQEPANLAEVMRTSPHDIVLAERGDISQIPDVAPAGWRKATIVAVLEDPSSVELATARQQREFVLKTPQSVSHILNFLDDVMKTRLDGQRTAPPAAD